MEFYNSNIKKFTMFCCSDILGNGNPEKTVILIC